jgi:hypothetical protein
MKVIGTDPDGWIEFTPIPELSNRSFYVSAVHGRYRVDNNSLALLQTGPLLEDLVRLERIRHGFAHLVGTYDFDLDVESHGAAGAALVRYRLSDQWFSVPANQMHDCRLESAIGIPGEMVASVVAGFRELLSHID